MSAQEFRPGDRVRVVKASGSDGNLAIGDEHVVKRVNSAGDVSWGGQVWARERFVKVEPEFVVGQQVKDEDYDRLPVGAKAGAIEKTGEHEWRDLDGRPLFQSPHATRHLNYLPEQLDPEDDSVEAYCVKDAQDGDWWVSEATPEFGYGIVYSDGTHPTKTNDLDAIEANYGIDAGPEPEDKDDLYVEPEPLKEDQRTFNDDDVQRLKVTHGSEVLFDGLAVFEEADDGKVTVTPVPRCTSLFIRPGSDSSLGIVRCGQHQGHGHGHWTIGEHPATSWNDNQEYGRVTEGGAS